MRLSQRISFQTVQPRRHINELWLEFLQNRFYCSLIYINILFVSDSLVFYWIKRKIEIKPFPLLLAFTLQVPCSRIKFPIQVLVYRNVQYLIIFIQQFLSRVSVVNVPVQNQYLIHVKFLCNVLSRNSYIIQNTKTSDLVSISLSMMAGWSDHSIPIAPLILYYLNRSQFNTLCSQSSCSQTLLTVVTVSIDYLSFFDFLGKSLFQVIAVIFPVSELNVFPRNFLEIVKNHASFQFSGFLQSVDYFYQSVGIFDMVGRFL